MKDFLITFLPDITKLNTYLYIVALIAAFYLKKSSRNTVVFLFSLLIVVQAMTPIAYKAIAGITGLQPVYLLWLMAIIAVISNQSNKNKPLRFNKYFSPPLLLLLVIQLIAWFMTFLAGPEHTFYLAGFDRFNLTMGYLLSPIQVLLTGWMAMILCEEDEDRWVIDKAIMISAIIFGALISIIYLKTGSLSGAHVGFSKGRHAIHDYMKSEVNGLAGVCVFFFIYCLLNEDRQTPKLRITAIFFTLAGILFSLSRMAWIATGIVTILMFPKFKTKTKIFILIIFLGFYWQFHTLIKNRIQYGFEKETYAQQEKADNVTAGRVTLWEDSWEQAQENLVFGTGIQTAIIMRDGRISFHPHSAYLRVILDMGLVGMSAIMLFYCFIFFKSGENKGPLFYSIIILFIMGFVCLQFHPHKQNYLFWLYYGLFLGKKEKSNSHPENYLPTKVQ